MHWSRCHRNILVWEWQQAGMHAVLLIDRLYHISLVHEDGQVSYRCSTCVLVYMVSSRHGQHLLWVTDEDICLDTSINWRSSLHPKSCSTRFLINTNREVEIPFHETIRAIDVCAVIWLIT
jgi:hypothetical protein